MAVSGSLEALLGHLLAHLTGAGSAVTIAMFNAVISTEAQRSMLASAAETVLAGAELDEFRDLMHDFRTRYGERSRLVHNLWGTSPDHPDKAVWCLAKDATRLSSALASISTPEEFDDVVAGQGGIWRHCSTYTVQDLDDVLERLAAYRERVANYVLKLNYQHPVIGARLAQDQKASAAQASEPPPQSLPGLTPG